MLASITLGLVLLAAGPAAQADQSEYACTIERRCSSNGMQCAESDRACKDEAREKGLEIICEAPAGAGFVYCPPTTGRGGDSRALWLLLGVAGFIAVGGSTIAWVALKGSKAR